MYVKFVTDGSVQNQGFEASYEISLFQNELLEVPEYAKMQLYMVSSLKHNNDVT